MTDHGGYRIGIDLGGTKIEGVILGEHPTEPIFRRRVATPRDGGYEPILAAVVGLIRLLLGRIKDERASIGIGIPGIVSVTHGRVKNANTTELIGRPLKRDIEAKLGRKVLVENDANCFALAEALHGAGRGARCVFGVILGTGVGGGIVLDRKIWSGAQGIAGEWGHTTLEPQGPECYCGRRGCVELYLSGTGLARAYAGAGGGNLHGEEIWARGQDGDDPIARGVVADYKSHFGRALAQVINILDPTVVVLGGGVSNAPGLAEEAPALLRPHLFNDEILTVIRRHELGDSAGVLGAAWLGSGDAE
jgi:fructokinase